LQAFFSSFFIFLFGQAFEDRLNVGKGMLKYRYGADKIVKKPTEAIQLFLN